MTIEFRPNYNGSTFENANVKVILNRQTTMNGNITRGTENGDRIKL